MLRALRRTIFGDIAKGRAIELDAIRGLAIVLAMGWHINKPTGVVPLDALLFPGSAFGWVGVDIFFVLSGFLIGGLIIREIDATQSFRFDRFLIRRAFRLWPVLYLYLVAQLIVGRHPPLDFFPQVFFHVQNYFRTPLNQMWSLAVEEQFYLIAGLALPWLARKKLTNRTFAAGLIGLALACIALRTAMWFAGADMLSLQYQTQYRADALLAGILLALIKIRRRELYDRIQRGRAAFVLVTVLCAVGLTFATDDLRWLVGVVFGTILGVSLILAVDGYAFAKGARAALRPLAFMGLYSYSIYIWHPGLGRAVEGAVSARSGSVAIGVLVGYAAVIAISVAITRIVERPMIDLRNRLFPSTHPTNAAEALRDAQLTAPRASP